MEKIKVYGTDEGKLYIKTSELFSLKSVQELIFTVSRSEILKNELEYLNGEIKLWI